MSANNHVFQQTAIGKELSLALEDPRAAPHRIGKAHLAIPRLGR